MVASIVDRLKSELGQERVDTSEAARRKRRHDYWLLSQLDDMEDRGAPLPACVVRPESTAQVVRVVDVCRETATPLVPYGLGSGVCGAIVTAEGSVVLDLGAMTRVRGIEPDNLLATFEAGVRGSDAEWAAREQGMTLGHYPQSIEVSTVGGWVATRAAGQFSTGYGNIEDVVVGLEAVLPNGKVLETRRTPRASAGPDLKHLLLGSEGTLGVVTAVTFSLRRVAERQACSAYYVTSMAEGFELQREIIQSGWHPVVMRQYDAMETQRMFSSQARGDDALLLLVHEGPAARVDVEVAGIADIAASRKAEPAPAAAVEHWLGERNHVPTFKSFLDNGVVVDTIEVAATWDRILPIYDGAVEALGQVSGLLAGSAHSSHVYRSGINLYFTFAAQPADRRVMRATYLECWRRVMEATARAGGGLSHHHGIGRVRRPWLPTEIGPTGVDLLRSVKRAVDPIGFMNPGALLPESSG